MTTSKTRCNKRKRAEQFFIGQWYPAFVCILAILGYVTCLELYTNIVIMLSLAVGLLLTSSIRPLITPLLVLMFQIPPEHSPAKSIRFEWGSDYYFKLHNAIPTGISFFIAIVAIIIVFVRLHKRGKIRVGELPFLIPSVLLSAAFLLGGVFGGAYRIENLGLAFAEILGFFLIFYVFYLGLRGERGKELLNYFVYVNSLIAILLVLETIWIYYTGEVIAAGVDEEMQIIKTQIYYGWGLSSTAGQAMTVTLPLLFYGAMKSRAWPFYISVAVLALSAVLFTLSRGAITVAALTIFVCVVIGCFHGRNKRVFKILLPVGLAVAALVASLFFSTIESLFFKLFDVGFSDNGRFKLWYKGFDAFLRAPIFGEGFWSFSTALSSVHIDLFPPMLHNTVIQLLGSLGLFGIVAYAIYRFATLRPFFRFPSLGKTMIGVSILTLLLQSLLDNFIFYIQPMFYYGIALAIAVKLTEGSEREALAPSSAKARAKKAVHISETASAKVIGTDLVARPVYRKRYAEIKLATHRIKVADIKFKKEEK